MAIMQRLVEIQFYRPCSSHPSKQSELGPAEIVLVAGLAKAGAILSPAFGQKRTITENDIMTFAALSGDDNRIHTDPEVSKTMPFGRQVAHGILGLAIASGLAWQTGILDGTVIAFREINEWKFAAPVFIGDVLQAEEAVQLADERARRGAEERAAGAAQGAPVGLRGDDPGHQLQRRVLARQQLPGDGRAARLQLLDAGDQRGLAELAVRLRTCEQRGQSAHDPGVQREP